ncbi:MAG: hypothetical protein H6726_11585 [Sandaracinaceae bacterium]|nr:hypothetical protein [Sandaracinaceae bacterium]
MQTTLSHSVPAPSTSKAKAPAQAKASDGATAPTGRYAPRRALRALAALLRDPNATDQVFIILDALSGRMLDRTTDGMRADPVGAALLENPPALVERLLDRAALRALGPETLAHAYLAFVESEGITADGLLEADVRTRDARSDVAFMQDWLRDTHDLEHALTGYKGDLIGEAALLAFDLAQHPSPGLALIVLAGYVRFGGLVSDYEPNARRIIRQGFMRGLRARKLLHVDYTDALSRDVNELRAELRLGPPPQYRAVRPHEVDLA